MPFYEFFSFIYAILRTFYERHSVPFRGSACDVTSEVQNSDVTFSVACGLSQCIGKTEFSSTAKNRTSSVSQVRKAKSKRSVARLNILRFRFSKFPL